MCGCLLVYTDASLPLCPYMTQPICMNDTTGHCVIPQPFFCPNVRSNNQVIQHITSVIIDSSKTNLAHHTDESKKNGFHSHVEVSQGHVTYPIPAGMNKALIGIL